MDNNSDLAREIEQKIIIPKKRTYCLQAYIFLFHALDALMHEIISNTQKKRHVTGAELSIAFKKLAIDNFGPMAFDVLQKWGIHRTIDIGNMVYDLIEIGLMGKTTEDRLEDFTDVYDIRAELLDNFRFEIPENKL